ncbi:MAG: amidohydrolase, partial [Acidaminococcus sp.]|nr:amidohydrolase [Acidaminococcus sp.]
MVITDKEELKQKVFAMIDASEPELRAYAEDVASEPEYGFKEFKTSAKLAAQFDKLGIPYRKGMAITAVKG